MSGEWPVEVKMVQPDGTEQRLRVGTAWEHDGAWSVWLDPSLVDRRSARAAGQSTDPRVADLEFLAARARKTLDDPRRVKWHEEAREQLLQIEAEIDRVQSR